MLALHSQPLDRTELRGVLVRQTFEGVDFASASAYGLDYFGLEYFPPSGARTIQDEYRQPTPWRDDELESKLYAAMLMSGAFGALLGYLLFFGVERTVKRKRIEGKKRKEATA